MPFSSRRRRRRDRDNHRRHWFSLVEVEGRNKVVVRPRPNDNDNEQYSSPPAAAADMIDPQRLEDYILHRLQEAKQFQETQANNDDDGDCYNVLYLDGFLEGDPLTFSPKTASALIQFLEEHAGMLHRHRQAAAATAAGHHQHRSWEELHIENCRLDEPFFQVLEAAKRLGGIFPHLVLHVNNQPGGDDKSRILEHYCHENPTLTTLRLTGFDDANLVDPDINLFFDRNCAVQLKSILDTKKFLSGPASEDVNNHHHYPPPVTRLKTLTVYIAKIDSFCWEHVAAGLNQNDSLEELEWIRIHTPTDTNLDDCIPPLWLESLNMHSSLRTLELDGNGWTASSLLSLGSVMKHSACRITCLNLGRCWSIPEEGNGDDHRHADLSGRTALRIDLVADALEGSQSLECLSLRNCEGMQDSLHRILELVDTCPNLRDIDLFRCKATGPFWVTPAFNPAVKQQQQQQQQQQYLREAGRQRRRGLHRFFLTGNSIVRGEGNGSVSPHDQEVQDLLLRYPGLGELNDLQEDASRSSYFATFSIHTNRLLAWNYASRGYLMEDDQAIPLSLWTHVIDRIKPAVWNFDYFLASSSSEHFEEISDTNHRILYHQLEESCRASILFCLLRQQPTQVTLEACASPIRGIDG